MRSCFGKAVLAALSAFGIMVGAGGAAAIPLQVTGEGFVFGDASSSVSLGGLDLTDVGSSTIRKFQAPSTRIRIFLNPRNFKNFPVYT